MTTVLLSSIPSGVIQQMIGKKSVRRWIYLGVSDEVLPRLSNILPTEGRIDYARELYETSAECRSDFVAWIDQISLSGSVQKEWFFSIPATKNPYSSQLFLNVCYYLVAQRLMALHKDIDLIVVDSPALGRLLVRHMSGCQFPIVNNVLSLGMGIFGLAKSMARYAMFVFKALEMLLAARQVLGGRVQNLFGDDTPRTLIRNYITEDFSVDNEGMFERHFFPGLGAYLEEHGKMPVFLPITVHVKSYKNLFMKAKLSRRTIIFAEEFLTFRDYLYAFTAPLRASQYRIVQHAFNGDDLSQLVVEDFMGNLADFNWLSGMLLSRLGLRLKARGINFESIINWAEFQSFERGLIAGLREAYPKARLIDSQPFCAPKNQLCLTLSKQERILKLAPDLLLVLGPLAKETARTYLPELKVEYTPAFRYQSIFDVPRQAANGKDLIVLFGYVLANSVNVLKMIIELHSEMQPFQRILIKLHPATYFNKERLIRAAGGVIPANVVFIDGALEQYLDSVCMGICGTSGTAVELVVRGIPVVVVAEERRITMNYLPSDAHADLWRLCFSKGDVSKTLNEFYKKKSTDSQKLLESALEFRQKYFAEPNSQNWENYLTGTIKEAQYAA